MTNKALVMVFTRNPELGKVKTRLAKTIGDENALKVYKHLLSHAEKTIRKVKADKAAYYSEKIRDNDIWDSNIYQKYKQEGQDLGLRMQHAFSNGFSANYNKVIIMASDLYAITPKHIEEAFRQLDNHEVVIGPSPDGGYYLLGMKTLHKQIFTKKRWSTATVFKETMEDLKNIDVHLLEELNDIDTYNDIKDIPELIKLLDDKAYQPKCSVS